MSETPPLRAQRHIVLIGMAGVGKSAIGRLLSDQLKWPYVDTDREVESESGCSVSELFSQYGEPHFRSVEERCLTRVVTHVEPSVIATGGGIVLRESNRRGIADQLVVWLSASLDTIVSRVRHSATKRPLLAHNTEQRVETLLRERTHLYKQCADIEVSVEGLGISACVANVRAHPLIETLVQEASAELPFNSVARYDRPDVDANTDTFNQSSQGERS